MNSDGFSTENISHIEKMMTAFSSILIRNVNYLQVKYAIDAILLSATNQDEQTSLLEYLIMLTFYMRDIRCGKGERTISEYMFRSLLLNETSRSITLNVIELVPEYGSWRDLFQLGTAYIGTRLVDIVEKQILKDELALATGTPISLLAKWMPREGDRDVMPFVTRLVPGNMLLYTRMKQYRKRISSLNKAIHTVEIQMCERNFASIKPELVPSIALEKYTLAFLNQVRLYDKFRYKDRYPKNKDRIECSENFKNYFYKKQQAYSIPELSSKSIVNTSSNNSFLNQVRNGRYSLVQSRIRKLTTAIE